MSASVERWDASPDLVNREHETDQSCCCTTGLALSEPILSSYR